jgi:hypothetical protein
MGSQAHPQFHALVSDIQRNFPKARVTADAASEPLMIVVSADGGRVRDFISSADLTERGEPYRRFLDRLLRQLVDGQKETGDSHPGHGGDEGGHGARH